MRNENIRVKIVEVMVKEDSLNNNNSSRNFLLQGRMISNMKKVKKRILTLSSMDK
jgi:hypothetical protein